MATELSNYDNDYRERYRGTTAPSITGQATAQAANVSLPMPDETSYGLYGEGSGTAADPFNSTTGPLPAASTDLALLPDVDAVTGAFEGRYALDFTSAGAGAAISSGAVNPNDGETGELFFNTTDDKLYAWNGGAWIDVT